MMANCDSNILGLYKYYMAGYRITHKARWIILRDLSRYALQETPLFVGLFYTVITEDTCPSRYVFETAGFFWLHDKFPPDSTQFTAHQEERIKLPRWSIL
jgi:hypothetical protein